MLLFGFPKPAMNRRPTVTSSLWDEQNHEKSWRQTVNLEISGVKGTIHSEKKGIIA